jgi:hypothetical protein
LDGPFWRFLGIPDLFFFFWSSRPILTDLRDLFGCGSGGESLCVSLAGRRSQLPQNFGGPLENTTSVALSIKLRADYRTPQRPVYKDRPLHHHHNLGIFGVLRIESRVSMVSRRNRTLLSLAIFIGILAWNVAAAVKGETGVPVENLSAHEIEEQLQV